MIRQACCGHNSFKWLLLLSPGTPFYDTPIRLICPRSLAENLVQRRRCSSILTSSYIIHVVPRPKIRDPQLQQFVPTMIVHVYLPSAARAYFHWLPSLLPYVVCVQLVAAHLGWVRRRNHLEQRR